MSKVIVTYGIRDKVEKASVTPGIEHVVFEGEGVDVSDGYHTFNELYDHRIELFIALCKRLKFEPERAPDGDGYVDGVWRSKLHNDGSSYDGWFILGIGREKGHQITYHLPLSKWEETNFAIELDKAPEFDGHTPSDVLNRLKTL